MLLKLVDDFHKEKKIPKEVIFSAIEAALQQAIERSLGEDEPVEVHIDRIHGNLTAQRGDQKLEATAMDRIIASMGRILAQNVKQLITHKIRDAECQSVYDEYQNRLGRLVVGTVTRQDPTAAIIQLDKTEAILPRSEQIPGESYQVNSRVKAVIHDVRKVGSRVKVVLSRASAAFVERLFEDEIPEIKERIVEIRAIAREAGYRTKMAVSSIDSKVEAVGACVGVRGNRIKQVLDELGGTERIDIVRWNDSLQVMIPNALQPATVQEVILHPRLMRAIVMVAEDQLSLAIGKRGQNVRLGSKLVQLDLEIMTADELQEHLIRAEESLRQLPGLTDEMLDILIEEGFHSFEDITTLTVPDLADILKISEEEADELMAIANELAILQDEQSRMPTSSSTSSPTLETTLPTDSPQLTDSTEDSESDQLATSDTSASNTPSEADDTVAELDDVAGELDDATTEPEDVAGELDDAALEADDVQTSTESAESLPSEPTATDGRINADSEQACPGPDQATVTVETHRDVPASATEASPASTVDALTAGAVAPSTPADSDSAADPADSSANPLPNKPSPTT